MGAIHHYFNNDNKKFYKKIDLDKMLEKFDINIYKNLNKNKVFYDNLHTMQDYLNNNNNKIKNFKAPHDFDPNIYKKYKDLSNLTDSQLEEHYVLYGINEKRIYKLPEDFNINTYKNTYKDLIKLNNDQIIEHYINIGVR